MARTSRELPTLQYMRRVGSIKRRPRRGLARAGHSRSELVDARRSGVRVETPGVRRPSTTFAPHSSSPASGLVSVA